MVTNIGNHMVSNTARQRDSVFRAISDPTRREILNILRGGQQTVGGIAQSFRMSRPAISKHLRVLHSAGLVITRRHGTQTQCRLNAKPLHAVSDWLRDYETFWKESLQALKRHMEEER
jgi:DNA-binding transcriptional ArsR family regulator